MLRVFDHIEPIYIVAKDDTTQVLYANKMAKHRFHLEGDAELMQDVLLKIKDSCPPGSHAQIQDPDSGRWYRVNCEPFFWDEEADSLLFHCVDITAHIERESDLEREAHTDKLTGLNNRYAFEQAFDKLWETCRQNRSFISVAVFDIDFFKKVNDTYGHLQGDKCLADFAGLLKSKIGRHNDVIARFGGEEFVALLPYTNSIGAMKLADSVRIATEQFEIPIIEKGFTEPVMRVTVSCGVASIVPRFGDIQEELLSAADKALYRAKQTGRNKVCLANAEELGLKSRSNAASGDAAETQVIDTTGGAVAEVAVADAVGGEAVGVAQ